MSPQVSDKLFKLSTVSAFYIFGNAPTCVSSGFRQALLNFPQRVQFRFSEKGTHTCLLRSQTNFLNFPQRVHFRFLEKDVPSCVSLGCRHLCKIFHKECILDFRKRGHIHVSPQVSDKLLNFPQRVHFIFLEMHLHVSPQVSDNLC